jgi:FtsP/CotA-like multicopper oxidase with cupredoxin domain
MLSSKAVAGNGSTCARYAPGSTIHEAPAIYSSHGVLRLKLFYRTSTDQAGRKLYCFVTEDGVESPTLHVSPGDQVRIQLTNQVAGTAAHAHHAAPRAKIAGSPSSACGAIVMTSASVNMHYHGTKLPPVCHQDEVIRTLINSGETFEYDLHIPDNQPPGLYWYHPHVHGISEAAVLGGASGALIVDGIQNANPAVAGLKERVFIIRDNPLVPGAAGPVANMSQPVSDEWSVPGVPAKDLSLNYIPIAYPKYILPKLMMNPGERQFWRVLNASADTILDLVLQYNLLSQPFEVIALDGVPLEHQKGQPAWREFHLLLPPAARAEVIVTGPSNRFEDAVLLTAGVNTGPAGESDPIRPLLRITVADNASEPLAAVPQASGQIRAVPYIGLSALIPDTTRTLYFSESDPSGPRNQRDFFITVDGQKPVKFDPDAPPALTTTQGAIEDWIIENRSKENHEFHMHQLHFLLLERNGEPVHSQDLDTVDLPYWSGAGPYPSLKIRLDFRDAEAGDFLYHCHILEHEDNGMMAVIRVVPKHN